MNSSYKYANPRHSFSPLCAVPEQSSSALSILPGSMASMLSLERSSRALMSSTKSKDLDPKVAKPRHLSRSPRVASCRSNSQFLVKEFRTHNKGGVVPLSIALIYINELSRTRIRSSRTNINNLNHFFHQECCRKMMFF